MSWPYDEEIAPCAPTAPLRECPGGECPCHPTEAEAELFEVSIKGEWASRDKYQPFTTQP